MRETHSQLDVFMEEQPPILQLRVSGDMACFSRPEFSVERISYPWITPSAARALFEAVVWKPRIRFEIREIQVLVPIKYCSFRRNEIGNTISTRGLTPDSHKQTDQDRQQRNTTALAWVDYLIKAELHLNHEVKPTDPDDNHGKYRAMFERRLALGQHFHHPYLGMREFAADVRPPQGDERPIPVDMNHGLMLYDFCFPTSPENHRKWRKNEKPRPLYYDARMVNGIIAVPERARVLESFAGGSP